ncbi:unnamed protein product [Nippostrongylus brasiliensis]|uniref:Ancient ubiquitous protein 1 homolog (inferred by orthology to a C. elegans protein) n=1 Tax=Nippostrongylus brasiliensis TaxID=27835 RepID=A0A0N4XEU6_NIPBR|nr:unnamed protein product [Nippostrongylus brasiliensis]
MSLPPDIKELFFLERIPGATTKLLLLAYLPIGCLIFCIRIFVGVHTFFVACLLRKSTAARTLVLRVMCAVLGIVVRSEGKRSDKVNIVCGNHVSVLDHLAVDIVEPCVLPSVWDIPSIIRWSVARASSSISRRYNKRSKRSAEIQVRSWPCEVSDQVQPLALQISRPFFDVSPSVLGSSWLADVSWFAFLPFSVYHLTWLPVMQKREQETADEFALRVESSIAEHLGIVVTNLTHADAVEAAKRHIRSRAAPPPVKVRFLVFSRKVLDTRVLDDMAMRIKQSYPAVDLLDIRMDLERTKDQQVCLHSTDCKISFIFNFQTASDPSLWKRVYAERKWTMIETNRQRYLGRLNNLAGAGDQ